MLHCVAPIMQGDESGDGAHRFYRFEGYSEISVRSGPGRAEASQKGSATLSVSIYLRMDNSELT
ncbi:hypothetical protein B0B52_06480 [Polaromonas sp. A23]|nr:hypothetical protein B0B52_06480 [Polaromonas sp. A23]